MDAQELCLALLHADKESDVIEILKDAGYWDNPSVWRLYGDKEGNYATAGAQQAEPEAALVEKIINSVDASLINECLVRGIDPESHEAPANIRQAVAQFFNDSNKNQSLAGSIKEWSRAQRLEQAQKITLAATGTTKQPCLTVVDQGEGQSPNRIPDTILSLNKKNKQKIRFVQGKFNMGGTGVLRHCHEHGLQLVISRRNPKIVSANNEADESSHLWGFTIVRRERPSGKAGDVINSEFKYLAPMEDDPRGGVLRFEADELALMPKDNDAYHRAVGWGTSIKLYGYDMSAGASNVLRRNGLLYRLEALLPEIALPIRVHECRKFGGTKEKSYDTNLAGLVVRLTDGKGDNLEQEPWDIPLVVHGLNFVAKVFVFKRDKAKTYLRNQGIIFTINGQTHGTIPKTIFGRKKVGLSRIGKDLLVVVDCSDIPVDAREDLFMSSRDRLSKGELRNAIERQLEEILRTDQKLKQLQEQRRVEEQSERLADQKPLEDVLKGILKSSPSLSTLFLKGQRLNMPSKVSSATDQTRGGHGEGEGTSGTGDKDDEFVGNKHPTYFRFRKTPNSDTYRRSCEQGRTVRVAFETDVENLYFTRLENQGRYELEILEGDIHKGKVSHSLNLHDGIAQWSINLPNEIPVGSSLKLRCMINDDVILEPITNFLELTILAKVEHKKGPQKPNPPHGGGKKGDANQPTASGLDLPNIEKLKEGDKLYEQYSFDDKTACKVIRDNIDQERDIYEYTFYVNIDNLYLQQEMKSSKTPELAEAKFVYGNVLLGLSLIHEADSTSSKNSADEEEADNEFKLEEAVANTSRAMSPFIIPMIDYLGSLTSDDVSNLAAMGDDE